MRDEDEEGRRRRLLERLQERIGGGDVERLGGIDDADFRNAAVAREQRPGGEVAHAVDLDLGERLRFAVLVHFDELEDAQVRVLARR